MYRGADVFLEQYAMPVRNLYLDLNEIETYWVAKEVRGVLDATEEHAAAHARLLALSNELRARLPPSELALWLELDATHIHRADLRAAAHYNVGLEHGLALRDVAGDPAVEVWALVAALARAAERL